MAKRALPTAIKGVIFDMDGTLCLPQRWMFTQMRSALGIDKSVDILDHIESLEGEERELAGAKIRRVENEAMNGMEPQPGLGEVFKYINGRKLPVAILTRNFDEPVRYLMGEFLDGHTIEPVVTRSFKPPKPAPDGVLHITKTWDLAPETVIMVGDSIDDIEAGYSAGAASVLLRNEHNGDLADHPHCSAVIDVLDELCPILEARKA